MVLCAKCVHSKEETGEKCVVQTDFGLKNTCTKEHIIVTAGDEDERKIVASEQQENGWYVKCTVLRWFQCIRMDKTGSTQVLLNHI